ncbi:hypothetical protein D3C87_1522860 [compost metagenome]
MSHARQQGDFAVFQQRVAEGFLRVVPQGVGVDRGKALQRSQLVHANHHRQRFAGLVGIELIAAVGGQDDLLVVVEQHVAGPGIVDPLADTVGDATGGQCHHHCHRDQALCQCWLRCTLPCLSVIHHGYL